MDSTVSKGMASNMARKRGDHQVIHRMGRQGAQGVNLLGHAHGAQFRRDGGPDPPGDHQTGQHRPQFAAHGDADHGQRGAVHLDLVKLEIRSGRTAPCR